MNTRTTQLEPLEAIEIFFSSIFWATVFYALSFGITIYAKIAAKLETD